MPERKLADRIRDAIRLRGYYSVKHESLDTNVSVSCGHWRW